MGRKPKNKRRALHWGDGFINERPLKDGRMRYQARWSEPDPAGGVVWRSQTFGRLQDAEKHLRAIGEAKREDRYAPESRLTIAEAVAAHIERASALGKWKPNTTATNTVFAKRLIYPRIGSERVSRVTYSQLQSWVDGLLRSRKSASATRNALSLVSATLTDLVRMEVISTNPARGVEVAGKGISTVKTWTLAEALRVLASLAGQPRLHALYTLAISTGMRPGELRALKWEDIDLESGRMHVRRTITKDENQREMIGTTTKTGESRIVLLGAPAIDALTAWREEQTKIRDDHASWQDDDIVFDRGNGGFTPSVQFQNEHRAVIRRAKVEHINPHAIRHTTATLMMEQQTDYKTVGEILGHKSAAMTLDVYSHVSEAMQQTAAERMARRLLGVPSDTTTSGADTTTFDEDGPISD